VHQDHFYTSENRDSVRADGMIGSENGSDWANGNQRTLMNVMFRGKQRAESSTFPSTSLLNSFYRKKK